MHSFYLAPDQLELVVVKGPDAVKFLQGQLTCDVEALAADSFTRGAACNNKGRVFATFVLVRHADAYHLVFSKGLAQVFVTALKKYLPFYKCTLQLIPEEWFCLGVAGPDAAAVLAEKAGPVPVENTCKALTEGWLCNLGQQQFLLCTDPVRHGVLLSAVAANIAQGNLQEWQLADMQAGHFPFSVEDIEKYTPQDLQLDRQGYVSFTKGCYTGQEIVARMHYRGKVKKQLYLLSAGSQDAGIPATDFEVLDENGTVLGHTVKQAISASGTLFALAQLPVGLAENPVKLVDSKGRALHLQFFAGNPAAGQSATAINTP